MQKDSPQDTPIPGSIGPYRVLGKIASGGMGDVFLAEDPFCRRKLALKRIREDRLHKPGLKERFLKEIQIAAKLSHPCIIPIYQIHTSGDNVYYTMPLVEGSTLKEILRATKKQEKEEGSSHPIGSSLTALMRIFLHICQAMAYAHAKGVLHKDIKPENIIIGPYGEVLILDWGLAELAEQEESFSAIEGEEEREGRHDLTRPGKVAGTLSYLPPERLFGQKASFASDIYALGVILYQMLTLSLPFFGKNLKQYKQRIKKGKLIDPMERAPYRDIPPQLARIAKKCLSKNLESRYPSVKALLQDLNNYIEGRAEWVPCCGLQVESKEDWLLQENVLLSQHISLTRKEDVLEWVHLMIAKRSFGEKIKIETHVRIHKDGRGFGFLLNATPPTKGKEGDFFRESFFLWIGSSLYPGVYLFRSNLELLSNPGFSLQENLSHFVCLQKEGNHIRLIVNGILALDYMGTVPLHGPHIGLVLKDDSVDVGTLLVSSSSPNIQVHCLAVPDTLLTLRYFPEAKEKYQEIADSFAGRSEGREATYKKGITLLEEARTQKNKLKKHTLLEEALSEFSKLHEGTGSPLEFLGKSFIYRATQELDEEFKCLEFALRRFSNHPLIYQVQEQVLFRLHESSYKNRKAAYELALIALKHIPQSFHSTYNQNLLEHLRRSCEPLVFLHGKNISSLCIQFAFWLNKPLHLLDFAKDSSLEEKKNILLCLLHLGCPLLAKKLLLVSPDLDEASFFLHPIEEGIRRLSLRKKPLCPEDQGALSALLIPFYLLPQAKQKKVLLLLEEFEIEDPYVQEKRDEFFIYLNKGKKLDHLPRSRLLQGCLTAVEEGGLASKSFFSHPCEEPFPSSVFLLDHFFSSPCKQRKIWETGAFFYEKVQLFSQLLLFYRCSGQEKEEKIARKQLRHLFVQAAALDQKNVLF